MSGPPQTGVTMGGGLRDGVEIPARDLSEGLRTAGPEDRVSGGMEDSPPPASAGAAGIRPEAVPVSTALVVAAFAAVYLIWGSTYLGVTVAVRTIPPFLMAGVRFMVAGGLMYGFLRWRGLPAPTRPQWLAAATTGALLILAGNGGVTWAQGRVPSGISALMVASVPLWIMLVDWLRPGGQRPSGVVLAGLAAGAAGVVMIILSRNPAGGRAVDPAGALAVVGSSLCWALGSVHSRHSARPPSALMAVGLQMMAGGVLQFLTGLLLGEASRLHLLRISAESAWAFLWLTGMGSLVGYTAYVWLLQVSTPAKVSTYAYVNPFVAVILGHVILGESLPPPVLTAGLLILASVVLITRASRPAAVVRAPCAGAGQPAGRGPAVPAAGSLPAAAVTRDGA